MESELAERGVGRLLVAGAQTDACIRSTLHGAFTRGYDTVLVGDAHTTDDYSEHGLPPADMVIAHTKHVLAVSGGAGAHGRGGRDRRRRIRRDRRRGRVVGCSLLLGRFRTHQVSGGLVVGSAVVSRLEERSDVRPGPRAAPMGTD